MLSLHVGKSPCLQCTAHARATTVALHKCSLRLEDLKCFLQTVDLSFPSCLALFIGLRLCNAAILQFSIIFIHSSQFRAQRLLIRGKLVCTSSAAMSPRNIV